MRTSNIVQKGQSSREVGENAISMSIDEASSVFLMDALGKLYSRPAQAVLREYLSNAVDAHKAKGGKLPAIQITIPHHTTWSYSPLSIRDFGKGMSEEDFSSILSRYGASTKRDSNAMIGGFGLGAKSGFAVSNDFTMTSYQQGQGITVRFFKDNLNQGYVEVVKRFSTNEPDGLLVEVPIPESNVSELSQNALFTDFPFFLGYAPDEIDVRPDVGYSNQSVHHPKSFTALELGGHIIGWLGKKASVGGEMYALIGKVVYRIDVAQLARSHKLDKELMAVLPILTSFGRVHVIDVPIGSVDMPSAREEITYSERSLKTLSAILCKYALLVKQYLQKRLNVQETKAKALDFLVQLDAAGYPATSELTWKGHSFAEKFFTSSPMVYTRYVEPSRYPRIDDTASNLNFLKLQDLSNREENGDGIFRILVDTVADIPRVQKLLTEENIKSVLNIPAQNFFMSPHSALFIITTRDDALNDWLFSPTPLEVSALVTAAEKKKKEKERREKEAAELAKAEKRKREAEEERVRKEREAYDNASFSYFFMAGGSRSPSRDTVENCLNSKTTTTKLKNYYWSEEEIDKYASVTKALQRISNGREKTSLLFPFIATESPNTFNAVIETRNFETINYLIQLRLFLQSFFSDHSRLIIVGKGRNLEEFKTTYPAIESGVLLVKKTIKSQLADEYSPIMIAYNAIGAARSKYESEIKSLTGFVAALNQAQKTALNQEIIHAARRFEVFRKSSNLAAVGDKYLMEVLKAFATHQDIRNKSYSVDEDISGMLAKYPLLMKSNFNKYPPEVINHLLTYIKLCDTQQF